MMNTKIIETLSQLNDDEVKEASLFLNAKVEQMRLAEMSQFKIGDKVQFEIHDIPTYGIVLRHLRKTIEIMVKDLTGDKQIYRVYPELITSCMENN